MKQFHNMMSYMNVNYIVPKKSKDERIEEKKAQRRAEKLKEEKEVHDSIVIQYNNYRDVFIIGIEGFIDSC